jgi:hypothetical protein
MIMVHLVGSSGRVVTEDLALPLIQVQSVVRDYFGWDYNDDLSSANLMSKLFSTQRPYGVEKWSSEIREINKKNLQKSLTESSQVIIIGASVTDEELSTVNLQGSAIIAADGSVGAIANHPNLACVVTDFDGNPHLDAVAKCGVLFVAHAHGDNQQRWQKTLDKWNRYTTQPSLILTHQVDQFVDGLDNYGGFTDGDRAVCLAIGLGVKLDSIKLVGFSTGQIGQWSGSTNINQKMMKLEWMYKIIEMIGLEDQVDISASSAL